ncbi:MAG: type I-B CRISPR-associated protein Cas5b [Cyclobacteriaceae bacterium]
MKFIKAIIRGWTTSFRYPGFISGRQPSQLVPPPSTVLGLLSAVKGELISENDLAYGYFFGFESKAYDVETIYEMSSENKAKSNISKREILFDPKLTLFVSDLKFREYFRKPHFPLLIGRSQDIAYVDSIEEVDIDKKTNVNLQNTLLPFPDDEVYGMISAMPTSFTDTIPRNVVTVKPFVVISDLINYSKELFYDTKSDRGFHLFGKIQS